MALGLFKAQTLPSAYFTSEHESYVHKIDLRNSLLRLVIGAWCFHNSHTVLNLSGCTALQHLNCCDSSILNLDLSRCCALEILHCQRNIMSMLSVCSCSALVYIDCQHNNLSILSVSECECLKHLQCSFNDLAGITLSPHASLDTLTCIAYGLQPIISGGVMVSELECSATTLRSLSHQIRQRLLRVTMTATPAMENVSGFRDLKYLGCKFGLHRGSHVDLRECTSVELNCECTSESIFVLGYENVQKLILNVLGTNRMFLFNFTSVQEIHLILHSTGVLNLSSCKALRRV